LRLGSSNLPLSAIFLTKLINIQGVDFPFRPVTWRRPSVISILLVDDEPPLIELAKSFMQRDGKMSVDTATSAQQALSMMASKEYDALVVDYQMPGANGIELLKIIRGREDDIPFILFTGKGREDVAIDALNSGASFYLQKGGDPESQFAELANMVIQSVSKRRAEQTLIESEKRYRAIFDTTGAATCIIEGDMTISLVNAEFEKVTGYSQSEIQGQSWAEMVSREELPKLAAYHRQRRKDPTLVPKSYDIQLNDKWGRAKTFHVLISMIPGTLKSVCSFIDITDRIQTERVVKDAERFMTSVFSSIQDGISILDKDLNIVRVNSTMERWYAHHMPIVGRKCFEAYHGRSEPCAICPTLQTLRTGKVAVEIVPKIGPRNAVVGWLELYSFPQMNADTSELEGVIEYVRDVSERKRYEDALKQANEKLNLMGVVTRHDALNQLGVLTGWLSIAMDSTKDKDLLEYMVKSNEAAKMIRSQLEFTADYQEMGVRGPVWMMAEAALNRGVAGLRFGEVSFTHDLKGLEIYADPMIDKVFHNLADNSLRHGGKLTKIDVRHGKTDTGINIVFSDDGQGISAEEKGKIFEHGHGRHTGYGLFMARAILGITGISIEETGEPGKGARFVISVPSQKFRIQDKRE
jgi:PAS domain S-box-containing protein